MEPWFCWPNPQQAPTFISDIRVLQGIVTLFKPQVFFFKVCLILALNAYSAWALTYLVVDSGNDVFAGGGELTFVSAYVDADVLVAVELINCVGNLSSGIAVVGVKVSGEIESSACHFCSF